MPSLPQEGHGRLSPSPSPSTVSHSFERLGPHPIRYKRRSSGGLGGAYEADGSANRIRYTIFGIAILVGIYRVWSVLSLTPGVAVRVDEEEY